MTHEEGSIDQQSLNSLEDRLRRGIPKWEQSAFIEMGVPILVEQLQSYMKIDRPGPSPRD